MGVEDPFGGWRREKHAGKEPQAIDQHGVKWKCAAGGADWCSSAAAQATRGGQAVFATQLERIARTAAAAIRFQRGRSAACHHRTHTRTPALLVPLLSHTTATKRCCCCCRSCCCCCEMQQALRCCSSPAAARGARAASSTGSFPRASSWRAAAPRSAGRTPLLRAFRGRGRRRAAWAAALPTARRRRTSASASHNLGPVDSSNPLTPLDKSSKMLASESQGRRSDRQERKRQQLGRRNG